MDKGTAAEDSSRSEGMAEVSQTMFQPSEDEGASKKTRSAGLRRDRNTRCIAVRYDRGGRLLASTNAEVGAVASPNILALHSS